MTTESWQVLRFSLNERLQHAVLMACTVVLVVSGLSLRYADTALGHAIIDLEGGIEGRGLLHRVTAAVLMALSAYHALYVVFTERGHRQLMAMMPRWGDLRDLLTTFKYNLGVVEAPPRVDRFDFRQKFQYWAVAVALWSMVVTGVLLWFETEAMAVMPKWVVDVALAAHSGESLLVFLVLFVWHLYDTHLRPGVFPMDRTWLTGRLSMAEMQERHPLEYERLVSTGQGGEDGK